MTGNEAAANDREGERSRFVVGIDLGTTNCAVAAVDTHAGSDSDWEIVDFRIPQWVDFNVLESLETLPSFHYQCTTSEADAARSPLPWQTAAGGDDSLPHAAPECVGVLAREAGRRNPGRLIQSAKSWLAHEGIDRGAEFLPWHGDPDVRRMSPVAASAAYLMHIRSAWNAAHPDDPLEDQDVVITLPASFDEVARELTVAASKRAGLSRILLIEEPQAAFYAWIDRHRDTWESLVHRGDLILVCDIGGGTTDLTLIRVKPAQEGRSIQFHRVAVGRHLILGGDNLDLAIATAAETRWARSQSDSADEPTLPPSQWARLISAARGVKETMLSASRPDQYTISLPAQGSSLLGDAIQITLTAQEIDQIVLDGFFPDVPLDASPLTRIGFQEFSLPYAADPAITRHLADFLRQHHSSGIDHDGTSGQSRPTHVLFNGGVMTSPAIRDRVVASIASWFGRGDDYRPTELTPARFDLAVARGAAYFAMVRRGHGVRIAANLGRSYYLQINQNPAEAICLIPAHAEAGQGFAVVDQPLRLSVGTPVQFPLWVSRTRLADRVGDRVAIDPQSMSPLPPMRTALTGKRRDQTVVDVGIESELSEIGTVGVHCVETESRQRWRLEFDIRSTLETDRTAHTGSGEAAGIVDDQSIDDADSLIAQVFGTGDQMPVVRLKPGDLIKRLQTAVGSNRSQWPPSMLRRLWATLMRCEPGRRIGDGYESRWLNLVGYCLRPGYGVAVDDWRVGEVWRKVHGKLAFPAAASRTEALILWRRIAGGMTPAVQQQLAAPWLATLSGKATSSSTAELAEAWRLVASLEHLSHQQKESLGETACRWITQPRHAKLQGVLVWSIGRLGGRQPIYAPPHTVLPATLAGRWAKQITAIDWPPLVRPMTHLAVVNLTRRMDDRYRDVPVETRRAMADYLRSTDAPSHYPGLLIDGGTLPSEDQSALFGETLPLGIHVRG